MAMSSANRLDKSQPYAEVHGILGAVFEQNGRLFTGSGVESANAHGYPADEPPPEDDGVFAINPLTETETPPPEPEKRDMANMHWKHLKSLVEAYGGEWKGRDSALAFLKGKSV